MYLSLKLREKPENTAYLDFKLRTRNTSQLKR